MESGDQEQRRYLNGMRVVCYAFMISSALFSLVALSIPLKADAFTDSARFGFWRLLPLCGVLILLLALKLPAALRKSAWYHEQKGLNRIRAVFLTTVLRLMLLESAIVPAIFYFLITGSTIWVLLLGAAGIAFMFFTIPTASDL